MDIFDVLTMIGGLSLFLFGMSLMGDALERRAGNSLRSLLSKLTTKPLIGLLTGLGVTAIIQSSSATTVMVVGFVNSGLMTLRQAINVIMGANIGTTVTAWILSLSGIESSNLFMQLLKPTSFTPVLALIGVVFYVFLKDDKKRDTGMILLGFATLMFGMDTMSDAVKGLADVPQFQQLFLLFTNPILGMLAGMVLTGIIQSSSASVGILQALAATGQVTYGAAIPIIMGQNIGTTVTALLSSVGTTKNARRAALVHLSFNVIGTAIMLTIFGIVQATIHPVLLDEGATHFGIAVAHSCFNVACTLILLPMGNFLEKLVCKLIPEDAVVEKESELDERLMATPPIALQQCHAVTYEMASCAVSALKDGLASISNYTAEAEQSIRDKEEKTDHYEDILSSYLVKLSTMRLSEDDNRESAMLLKVIGDLERIADHSVNVVCSAKELHEKGLTFTDAAQKEMNVLTAAIDEILDLSVAAFVDSNLDSALLVEPLEQIIDRLTETLRLQHIYRLQQGGCSIEAGFVWADLLTALGRTSDHCSNIAGCVLDFSNHTMNIHESIRALRNHDEAFRAHFESYAKKYSIA